MRKILIITTTFFPDPQVQAIRMTQWCRHLPTLGWRPHVLCRNYGFETTPEELATRVHPDVVVEYLNAPSGFENGTRQFGKAPITILARRLVRHSMNGSGLATALVPDASILFWRTRRQQVFERVRAIQPDVILTSSPPHSVHSLGLWLAMNSGLPWVADFRDPYLTDNRFQPRGLGRLRWLAHQRFKDSVYSRAWLVTHAIPSHARHARRHYASARDRILSLTNAYPPEMLVNACSELPNSGGPKTVLVTGTIPEHEQVRLAQAVAQLVAEGADVHLKILGKRPGCESELLRVLDARLTLPGYVSHTESVAAVVNADVLVNFLDRFRSRSRLLSTKLFEYLASGNPIVCLNPSYADRLLLRRKTGVKLLNEPSQEQLVTTLREALAGELKRDPREVERFRKEFSWPNRSSQLASALDRKFAFPPKVPPRAEAVRNAPAASVVIPTRNRKELLHRAICSALAQTVPVEVIVLDDGSTDGTVDMVRSQFQMVRLFEFGMRRGPSFLRNRGIELATSEFAFPIDDDSIFSTPHVVEQTLAEFDRKRVAAVGIPYLNPRLGWTASRCDRDPENCLVIHAFVGAAHAVRRSAFLSVGGFREHFFYMGEEDDLCVRMLGAGYVARQGAADPIYHLESPLRDSALADRCGRRNDVLFAWHNVPGAMFPIHLAATTYNGIAEGIKTGRLLRMLRGTAEGYACTWRWRHERRPVRSRIYWLHRRLKKGGPVPLEEIESLLPPVPSF